MSNVVSGDLKASSKWKVGIVVSRFNELISGKLLSGAEDTLVRSGVNPENIDIYWVPGAFEIPSAAKRVGLQGVHQGLLCLGAVIRGSTPHFDYVASESAKGIASLGMDLSIPVINSVLTTDSLEQAMERAGTKAGNKGADGAIALIEMVSLYSKIR